MSPVPPASSSARLCWIGRLAPVLRQLPRILLGLFVLFQLAWLLAANLAGVLELASERRPAAPALQDVWLEVQASERLAAASHGIQKAAQPWAELSNQPQSWGLFAPDVSDQSAFSGVEMAWDDAAVHPRIWLPSPNHPDDLHRFFRLGRFRLRRYETHLALTPAPRLEHFDPKQDPWPAQVQSTVHDSYRSVGAYLRWQWMAFARAHPDLPPPTELILAVQLYQTPAPPGPRPWSWQDLGRHPLARWRPQAGRPPGSQPLEVYDPRTGRFE